jgi:aromatic ring-opening dioxygenase catalytic subunit (LigB family)
MQPAFYIPHGGGPCFFMEDPQGIWAGMAEFLRGIPDSLPEAPSAILIVSGHWETNGFALTGGGQPPLVFDYYGFPPHTYQLRYDAPGSPALAAQIAERLRGAGFAAATDATRGYDHGVFVPLKVAFPDAKIPVIELSLDRGLDAALHLSLGESLAPLREQNVLVIGAGMSVHNLRALGDPRMTRPATEFDAWLNNAACAAAPARAAALSRWQDAPNARLCHPRHEHLLPLMVAAGSSGQPGQRVFHETVLGTPIAGFRFD